LRLCLNPESLTTGGRNRAEGEFGEAKSRHAGGANRDWLLVFSQILSFKFNEISYPSFNINNIFNLQIEFIIQMILNKLVFKKSTMKMKKRLLILELILFVLLSGCHQSQKVFTPDVEDSFAAAEENGKPVIEALETLNEKYRNLIAII